MGTDVEMDEHHVVENVVQTSSHCPTAVDYLQPAPIPSQAPETVPGGICEVLVIQCGAPLGIAIQKHADVLYGTYGSEHDLTADHNANSMLPRITRYDAVLRLPVLVTFDTFYFDHGNSYPLRVTEGKGQYGIRGLPDRPAMERTRLDNLLLVRIGAMITQTLEQGIVHLVALRNSTCDRHGSRACSPCVLGEYKELVRVTKATAYGLSSCVFDPHAKS